MGGKSNGPVTGSCGRSCQATSRSRWAHELRDECDRGLSSDGAYAGRVLRGTQSAEPIVRSKFELVINAQTARLTHLTIAPTLLATADEVIERDAAQRPARTLIGCRTEHFGLI